MQNHFETLEAAYARLEKTHHETETSIKGTVAAYENLKQALGELPEQDLADQVVEELREANRKTPNATSYAFNPT